MGVTIYRTNEFFGEAALINQTSRFEQAVALEDSLLLNWPATEIVEAIVRHPHLGVAIATDLVEREADLRWRIESFHTNRILQRVARILIRLSDRLGTPEANGWVRMIPLTHKLISQYVGSTRENCEPSHDGIPQDGFRQLFADLYSRQPAGATEMVGRGDPPGRALQRTMSWRAIGGP